MKHIYITRISKPYSDSILDLVQYEDRNKDGCVISAFAKEFAKACICRCFDISIEELEFNTNQFGKPYLKYEGIYFNISHSDGYVAVAVADEEIGIDIQKIKQASFNVAARLFDDESCEAILKAEDSELAFTKEFAMLESALKLKGTGFCGYNKDMYAGIINSCDICFLNAEDYVIACAVNRK
ncbi:MAG: 4'-phosphopantetheinyl transferase superfamily protein [Clostridiales bacterium]|nr:4'-phosphopantetheinyl transferase superfamily protein [Clostridiales bacterium]